MNDVENDIGRALIRLRAAFAKHGIPCPSVLCYDDSKSAYKALIPLRHSIGPAHWGMTQGANPVGEVCLAGFTLRFDAQRIERPGTGLELDDGISGRVFFDGLGNDAD